jgi:hypothetical protein
VNFQSCSRKIEILDVDKQLLKHLPVCTFINPGQHFLQVESLLGSQKGLKDFRSHLREEVAARSDYVNLHEQFQGYDVAVVLTEIFVEVLGVLAQALNKLIGTDLN